MKKIIPYLRWTLILLFIGAAAAVFALFGSYTRTDMEKLYLTPIVSDPNGWEIYVMDNGKRVYLTPQELLETDLNRTYYISRILTQDMRDSKYTLLNLSNSYPAAVFLDGELIYTNCPETSPKLDDTVFPKEFDSFGMRGENSYCTLPENYVGKRLTVATEHREYKSMPMVIMSSMTVGWSVHGATAISHYEVLAKGGGLSLLRLLPETGRTHQLRVHMACLGCPLAGDWLYGTEDPGLIPRPALHSCALELIHPVTGERLELSVPLPEDMRRLLGKMKDRG